MKEKYWIFLGTQGWEYADWRGNFYPDDMPTDWSLSFYNTRFQTVFFPHATWKNASDIELKQWLQDTQEGFRFLLEAGLAGDEAQQCEEKFAGRAILATPEWCDQHLVWLPVQPDLRALAERVTRQVSLGRPLFLVSREGNLDTLERVGELLQIMGY